MRLVIDTSVLISALITVSTPPDQLYQAWKEGVFELVISQTQMDEFVRVAGYPKLQRFITPSDVAVLTSLLSTSAILLTDIPSVNYSPDPNDNHIIAAAIRGGAHYIVSGDKRHLLSLGEVEEIPIITARQAVDYLLRA